ncbi:MAG TPA: S9 family peptidase [Vicinamibacterales bacterium]|nr:S9 family peptidase [Vicinamibacterales bacterium]
MHTPRIRTAIAAAAVLLAATAVWAQPVGFHSRDLSKMKAVGAVQISPDGTHLAYTVENYDRPGRPYPQIWIEDLATGRSIRPGLPGAVSSNPRWSPDGGWLAYDGSQNGRSGLMIERADGSHATFLAPVQGTNSPLPGRGESVAWAPDGRSIAFVSAVPGPETAEASGDPEVITRYDYKPTASEGLTRFNDNRRLHIFIVDVATRQVRQLTTGDHYEHSIQWSPDGRTIVFISNHEPDQDRVFNYDIFTVTVADGAVRRLTFTRSAEYDPRWSPDGRTIAYLGTRRPLTSSETTMEDTHVWLIDADGRHSREIGGAIDGRQEQPAWAPDGRSVYTTVQERGSVHLYRIPIAGGAPQRVIAAPGVVGDYSVAHDGTLAYSLTTPSSPAEAYLRRGGTDRVVTAVARDFLAGRTVAPVRAFTTESFDGKLQIESFLTEPLELQPGRRYPLIVVMHGGPHGQQGPAFNFKAQAYATHGFATLMVNYRGSTGYGQRLEDAIFADQDGAEAKDVLYSLDVAEEKFPWIDRTREGVEGVSYGGQLTDWLITQTNRFRAAIPIAGISNLVSFNYMAYYHDYLAVEYGGYPTTGNIMDQLWDRSPLRYAARVHTPTMFVHGENDNDVPIAEAEQFYIALQDVGVETIMVRYPREGHGIRETGHVIDLIDRSLAWYDRHFSPAAR